MAEPYVKQDWSDGVTVINKSRLDHIEEGIYQLSLIQPEQGEPGKDGVTPQLRLSGDYLQVSTDNGGSWNNLVPLASITGPQGETGKAFSIYKTYPTIEAMNADAANVPEGSFVLIASTEDDPDNAKLYVKATDTFSYLTDMSGAQGIQGEPGKDGAPGVTPVITFHVKTLAAGEDATIEQSGSAEAPSVTIGVPRGADGTNGQNGSDGVNGKDGVTFTPSVDENANLSWTNNGGLENPPTVNIAPDLSDYVKYQEFVAGASDKQRKTIQLANADSISGVSTTGVGANLIMLSQWDKVDIGTTNYQMNLNSPDGIVQINDEKVVATTDQVEALGVHSLGNFSSGGQAEAQAAADGVFNNPAYNVLAYTVNGGNGYIINSVGTSQTKQFLYWQGKRYTRTVAKVEDTVQTSAWASDDGYVALPNRAVMPTLFTLTTEADSDTVKAALTSTQSNEPITLDDLNKCLQTGYVLRYYAMQSGSVFVGFNGQAFTLTYIGFANPTQDPAIMSICVNVTEDGVYSVTRNGTRGILLTSGTLAQSSVITGLDGRVSTLETSVADAATKTELQEVEGKIPSVEGLATTSALTEGLAGKANTEHTHEIADVTGLQALLDTLPVMIQIPIRTLQDKVYDQATIFGWFGVEDIAGLRGLFSSQHLIWLRYGIASMGIGHMMYRFVVEYAEVNSDGNTVKLVFSGLNTNNDKLAKYEFTAKLDGTLVSGNSNVQLTVTDQE
nr:MAG TPA: tail repeat-like protein [Caudoviricetes sp.]